MKRFTSAGLIACLVFSLLLIVPSNFGQAQTATNVQGVISSNTTWTKADSPINITGYTIIPEGVTVTIEPGVVVNFNINTLGVNGTLRAIGTSAEPIILNGNYAGRTPDFGSSDSNGILGFGNQCNGWNPQTGTGCIIEYANVISLTVSIGSAPVKLNNNVFSGSHAWGGILVAGDSIISNNKITGGSIDISHGAPVVSNNTLIGQYIDVTGGSPTITDNLLYSEHSEIRVIDNGAVGNVRIVNNIIANGVGFTANGGNVTFEHNLVLYCLYGCSLNAQTIGTITIQNNTIAFNEFGIESPTPSTHIIYNNLENNSQKNLVWGFPTDFNATYNWWGTTDAQAINQTISDHKSYPPAGNITFIPFLDAPNPQAPLVSSFVAPELPSPSSKPASTTEPNTTPSETSTATIPPTETPSPEAIFTQNMLLVTIGVLLAVVIVLLAVVALVVLRKKVSL